MRRQLTFLIFWIILITLAFAHVVGAACPTNARGLYGCPVGTSSPEWVNDINLNWTKLNFSCTPPLACPVVDNPTIALTGQVGVSKGGSGIDNSATPKGSIPAFSANGIEGNVSPNIAAVTKYLCETGTGSVGAMPTFCSAPVASVDSLSQISNILCPAGKVLVSHNPSPWTCDPQTAGDSIQVNSSNATDANFNNSTPAAAGGGVNMNFQITGSSPSSISAYCPKADSSAGCINVGAQALSGHKTFNSGGGSIGLSVLNGAGTYLHLQADGSSDPPDCTVAGEYGAWTLDSAGKLKVCENGAVKNWVYSPVTATGSLSPSSVTANTCADSAMTVTGAYVGGSCAVGAPAAGPGTNLHVSCYVDATDSVQFRFCNPSAVNHTPTSGTYRATITP